MDKSPDAFRTISEVAEDLDLPQHVLRFWETRFPQIRPLKRGGGRRYYRPDDVDLLRGIRSLLYGRGYTIKGVQRILKEEGLRSVQAIAREERNGGGAGEAAPPPAGAAPARAAPAQRPPSGADEDQADSEEHAPDAAPDPIREAEAASSGPAGTGFSAADIVRLREALDDLVECERVLARLRPEDGSGPA